MIYQYTFVSILLIFLCIQKCSLKVRDKTNPDKQYRLTLIREILKKENPDLLKHYKSVYTSPQKHKLEFIQESINDDQKTNDFLTKNATTYKLLSNAQGLINNSIETVKDTKKEIGKSLNNLTQTLQQD